MRRVLGNDAFLLANGGTQGRPPRGGVESIIHDAQSDYRHGRITRREFLRLATALGLSAGAAALMTSCGPFVSGPDEDLSRSVHSTPSASIQRGGTLRSAMLIQGIDHPARLAWVPGANIVRQVAEYLTETGPDNITRPHLLERWTPSEDLKTWTLFLRQGISFNNGAPLTADDVLFSFQQWLDPDVGSSMLGLLNYLGGMQNVEKVDDFTIRLHLQTPNIGVPEHLFHYPAVILPRTFEGDFLAQPFGTGAFTLAEYAEGERVILRRRPDYWRDGLDGQPLPYLDELIYVSEDNDAAVAALKSGQIDRLVGPRPADLQALKDDPAVTIRSASSAGCFLIRMRVDAPPWDDARVRNALKLCQDRDKILQLAYFGEGDPSIDAHFAPIHPAYDEKTIPAYDPDQARALLMEAGYPNGLEATLVSKNNLAEPDIAQLMKELAAPAGFELTLELTEPNDYWQRWTEVPLGITSWGHRPLETMVPRLAYTASADGNPTPFNETRWIDDEFTKLLVEAEATLDVEHRRRIVGQMEDVMQMRGPIGNSFWLKVWDITRSEFQNVQAGPDSYDRLVEVWKSG